jgi:dGTPase
MAGEEKLYDAPISIRERQERLEHQILSPLAAKSDESKGRRRPEKPCRVRPAFQRDRDRIIHCKAFRRLKHKTQVFLAPKGDHYRTRLTHTIEVSQIARTIARALQMNEDLTEAIALGHDLGHTPFGHAGEFALDEVVPGGFHHWEQSLRVVDELAFEGAGLNLTWEVRDGILKHSKGRDNPVMPSRSADQPATMEGKIVRVADIVAYTNHDLQDAIAAGLIKASDVPRELIETLGKSHSQRINNMVTDIVVETAKLNKNALAMSRELLEATEKLKGWLFERVYENEEVQREFRKGRHIIQELYRYLVKNPDQLRRLAGKKEFKYDAEIEARDFIAGMSDSYALHVFEDLFVPRPWAY